MRPALPARRDIALVLASALALVSAPAFAADPPSRSAAPAPGTAVTAFEVQPRPLPRRVVAYGSVVAWQELVVAAEASGLAVEEVLVEAGDRVTKGGVLARLDTSVLLAQLEQARAAQLEGEASLRTARGDLGRARELVGSGSTSRATLEQREAAVLGGEARLASGRGRVAELEARLAQAVIVAPHGGIVSRRSILPGAVSAAGSEAFRIIRDGRLEFEAAVPENGLRGLQPGQAVEVVREGERVTGRVRTIAPTLDPVARTAAVAVALPEGTGLRPGMSARAEIALGGDPVIAVPTSAVQFRGGSPGVFVVDGEGRAELRSIAMGFQRGGMTSVVSGLRAGERVVLRGAGFLNGGEALRVEAVPLPLPAGAEVR